MNLSLMPVSPLANLETTFIPEAVTVLPNLFTRMQSRPLREEVDHSYGLSAERSRRALIQEMDDEGLLSSEVFLDREIHELWEQGSLVGMMSMDTSMLSVTGSYDFIVTLNGVYLSPSLRGMGIGEALATRVGGEVSQGIIQQLEYARSWGKKIRVFIDGDLQNPEGERFFQQLVAPVTAVAEEASAAGVPFELDIMETY